MKTKTSSGKKSGRKGNTITLPASYQPDFPTNCVACNKPCQRDLHTDIPITAKHFLSLVKPYIMTSKFGRFRVPMHLWCNIRSRAGRALALLMLIATVPVTYKLVMIYDISRHSIKGVALEGSMITAMVLALIVYVKSCPVTVNREHDTNVFEFINDDYAEEFARMNSTAVGK